MIFVIASFHMQQWNAMSISISKWHSGLQYEILLQDMVE